MKIRLEASKRVVYNDNIEKSQKDSIKKSHLKGKARGGKNFIQNP